MEIRLISGYEIGKRGNQFSWGESRKYCREPSFPSPTANLVSSGWVNHRHFFRTPDPLNRVFLRLFERGPVACKDEAHAYACGLRVIFYVEEREEGHSVTINLTFKEEQQYGTAEIYHEYR